ncbi:unnamed protein product [Musa textilis]
MMLMANKKMESLRNTFEVVWPLIIATEVYERLRRRAGHHHQRADRTATAEAEVGAGPGNVRLGGESGDAVICGWAPTATPFDSVSARSPTEKSTTRI